MDLFELQVLEKIESVCKTLDALPIGQRIILLNKIKVRLHEVSPFKDDPVDCVIWVPYNTVHANDYNPNRVAPPEMKLLKRSVLQDGFTQPIVTYDMGNGDREVVDGFHRKRVGTEVRAIRDRCHEHLPVTTIKSDRVDLKDRMAATIRHNRARGVHGVLPMVDIVATLIKKGWTDEEVAKELGMDADEVLRFKQNSGLPELFKDWEYSKSWE